MFVRKTKTRNSICFQIGEKRDGKFILIKHIGCSSSPEKIEALQFKAKEELEQIRFKHQLSLFEPPKKTKATLRNWHITGFKRFFGPIYDAIGFPQNLLKDLTIARIVYPKSKLSTVRYLNQHLGIHLAKDTVYRFLDQLDKDTLTKIALDFVAKKNKGINLVFYDVTTLYFETDKEDDLRQKGYSKDHRMDMPQVVIGLLVDKDGYPFDFDIFEGSAFEGHTFKIVVRKLLRQYHFADLTIVTDAGMLSDDNINFLELKGIQYIVGARLKNLSNKLTTDILSHNFIKEPTYKISLIGKNKGSKSKRLLIDFSKDRAKKDKNNRQKLIEKLKQRLKDKKQTVKKSKYLVWEDSGKIAGLDYEKINDDERYDGLKGYITNLIEIAQPKEIIDQYHNLWKVEKAFRMSKSDLAERPIFHRLDKRIRSHLLLCFCSLLVMKEAENVLTKKTISLAKAIEIIEKVGEGEAHLGKITLPIESGVDQEVKEILSLVEGH